MRTPFFSALLAACTLHVVGLVAVSLGWQAWHVPFASLQPDPPVPVAVLPVPEPTPPPAPMPEPVTPPAPVAAPVADAAPEPIPAPPLVPSPQDVAPPLPKQVKPRLKPTLAQAQPLRSTPTRERLPRLSPPAPGQPDAPLESPGSGTTGSPSPPAAPELPPNPAPGEGADIGQLSAHGGVPVAPGSGTRGDGARGSTGAGTGGSTGTGRGVGGSGNSASARPIGGYQVQPRYPESARRQRVEGTVLLKMRITEQGRVED